MFSGIEHTLDVPGLTKESWLLYRATNPKPLIQDAFPRIAKEWREFMKTGVTPDEWNDQFGGME